MNFDYGVPEHSVTVPVFDKGSQCANYHCIFGFTQMCFHFFLKVNAIYRQTVASNLNCTIVGLLLIR